MTTIEPMAPERSVQQRNEALDRANYIRTKRADYKRDLRSGKAELTVELGDPPDWLLTAKVYDLLLAVPKYGRVKASKVLQQNRISPSKTMGGLSERQRRELIAFLPR